MNKRNLKVSLSLFFLVSCMIGLTFASVPLYKLFCQITGYGGTPKINTLNQSSTNLSTIKEIKIEPHMYTQNYEHFKRLVLGKQHRTNIDEILHFFTFFLQNYQNVIFYKIIKNDNF